MAPRSGPPRKALPARPNVEHLKKQAKAHLKLLRRKDPSAKLAEAQLAIARQYGFASWRKLRAHVEQIGADASAAIEPFFAAIPSGEEAFDPANFARKAVSAMERGWAESHAMIERRATNPGDGPRWEAIGLESSTLRERDADAAIIQSRKLGLFRMISIWHAAKIDKTQRTFLDFPPARSVEEFAGATYPMRPTGGVWQRVEYPSAIQNWFGPPGRWDDLVEALEYLRDQAPEGEYRVVTVRRMLMARREKGKFKIVKKHASESMLPLMLPLAPIDPKPESKKYEFLEPKAHQKPQKIAEWKPLMDAAYMGDFQRVAKLLAAGADPNVVSTTAHRYRPLHRAVEHKKTAPKHAGHERVVQMLLAKGADPSLRGGKSRLTALQIAAQGEPRFAPMLATRFEQLDIFHAAALLNHRRVGQLLKENPSLATAREGNGWTALHHTAASAIFTFNDRQAEAQIDIARDLIAAGADAAGTYLWDDTWPIPVMYFSAGFHDNPALAQVLMEAGAKPYDGESIYHAADEGHTKCLDLFEKMCDAKKLAAECTRCLSSQLHWGHSRGAKWLLEHGADPNVLHPRHGHSALHAAIRVRASEAIIRLLLKHGADPSVKTADGETAEQLARSAGAPMSRRLREAAGG